MICSMCRVPIVALLGEPVCLDLHPPEEWVHKGCCKVLHEKRIDPTEEVIISALSYQSSAMYLARSEPGPYDDAEMELKSDMLDDAIFSYVCRDDALKNRIKEQLQKEAHNGM